MQTFRSKVQKNFAYIQTDGQTAQLTDGHGKIDSARHADHLYIHMFYRVSEASFWMLQTSKQT